jgi:integrase
VTVDEPSPTPAALATAPDTGPALRPRLAAAIATFRFRPEDRRRMQRAGTALCDVLDRCPGVTLQERWWSFERDVWPAWVAGEQRAASSHWTWGVRAIVTARLVRPSWALLTQVRISQWVARLPPDDLLVQERDRLDRTLTAVSWVGAGTRTLALNLGLRLLLTHGYRTLQEIREQDLAAIPVASAKGSDLLDAALCTLGVFARTPQRGSSRHHRRGRRSVAELVADAELPARFRPITRLYLETYATRISAVYTTLRQKLIALGHFWRFLDQRYPEIQTCAEVLPAHARAFIPHAIERARLVQRGGAVGTEDRTTAHAWLIDVRTFFADVCTWATETDSPFAPHAPRTVPLTRHDLRGIGFEQSRTRTAARMAATVLDLEREIANIRAVAVQRWTMAETALTAAPTDARAHAVEAAAFWDWALLELLVQSGLRIEEASELTTLDVLKRRLPDGRIYYLLHVKPSKYDRARVIPIGDGLGRVIAEIIRHVRRFYGTVAVPFCDHWDHNEKQRRPPAPYLLQGAKHPSAIGVTTIRGRLKALSLAAGARTATGAPLILRPHDCRRLFASEHLNNNTPVHVIQALLGHATLDTVMVYAKLYPSHLIEEYRKAVRGVYGAVHGEESFRPPTAEEWAAFAAQCSLRDMGTHLCALPTGEHCAKGLVCLGCVHAQPKQSAVPVFRRMLASHERALGAAAGRGEPAGQIAARTLEVARIRAALRRAEELPIDVAAAIEAAAGG